MTAAVTGPGPSRCSDDQTGGTNVLDVVIQRLFALGLTVQSVAVSLDDERAAKLIEVVGGIDATIGVVRRHMTALLAGSPGASDAAGGSPA